MDWISERAKMTQWWADRTNVLLKCVNVIPFKAA
jgi:hypothetical protein